MKNIRISIAGYFDRDPEQFKIQLNKLSDYYKANVEKNVNDFV